MRDYVEPYAINRLCLSMRNVRDYYPPKDYHRVATLSMHSLWLPGGLAPPCRVISSGRKNHIRTSYCFDGGIFCQDGCPVQCNNSIGSLTETNEDKLTTKQLGLPRPNVSIQQVSTKGGKSYIQELERKKIAVVANAVCISYTTVTFHRFHSVFHSSLFARSLNNFLCDDLFCFCKPILSRSVNKYCWF